MADKKSTVTVVVIEKNDNPSRPRSNLRKVEKRFRKFPDAEVIPYAKGTDFVELAENVIKDKDGLYKHPIFLFESKHSTTIGVSKLAKKTREFLLHEKETHPMDILSVSAGIDNDSLSVMALVRVYDKKPSFQRLYKYLNEDNHG